MHLKRIGHTVYKVEQDSTKRIALHNPGGFSGSKAWAHLAHCINIAFNSPFIRQSSKTNHALFELFKH